MKSLCAVFVKEKPFFEVDVDSLLPFIWAEVHHGCGWSYLMSILCKLLVHWQNFDTWKLRNYFFIKNGCFNFNFSTQCYQSSLLKYKRSTTNYIINWLLFLSVSYNKKIKLVQQEHLECALYTFILRNVQPLFSVHISQIGIL